MSWRRRADECRLDSRADEGVALEAVRGAARRLGARGAHPFDLVDRVVRERAAAGTSWR